MMLRSVRPSAVLAAAVFALLLLETGAAAQTPAGTLPSEMPATFEATNDGFDHVRRDVMVPMRDGVKLHTVILVQIGRAHV